MTDLEKYIQSLESLVCFYASCYEACRETYQTKHYKTCSISNPNRRELTESEINDLMNFPQIQGSRMIFSTTDLSKIKVENQLPIREILTIIKRKHEKP